jgi:hypothetical protein
MKRTIFFVYFTLPAPTQEQDERKMQPMGNELVNPWNIDTTQKGKVNEQYQNVV